MNRAADGSMGVAGVRSADATDRDGGPTDTDSTALSMFELLQAPAMSTQPRASLTDGTGMGMAVWADVETGVNE